MGISGLLGYTKSAQRKTHLRKFSGMTAGIDANVWLYRGAFSCAQKLALNEETDRYIVYCMKYVDLLIHYRIKPILVFDGAHLPIKEETNKARTAQKITNKALGLKLYKKGNKREAYELFQRCLNVTIEMINELIKVLQERGIDYIVSPYESDAQLTFMSNSGMIDFVITEDSDMIVYGAKQVFYKLDSDGYGTLYDSKLLYKCMDLPKKTPFEIVLTKVRRMCLLCGCDYVKSLPGIGMKRAEKIVKLNKHENLNEFLHCIPSILTKPKVDITAFYVNNVQESEFTFLHQIVFDVVNRIQIPLNPYNEKYDNVEFSGIIQDPNLAVKLAFANVNTKNELTNSFTIENHISKFKKYKSIWNPLYGKKENLKRKILGEVNDTNQNKSACNDSDNVKSTSELYFEKYKVQEGTPKKVKILNKQITNEFLKKTGFEKKLTSALKWNDASFETKTHHCHIQIVFEIIAHQNIP
ncbi:DNA damage-inducible protein DIN7 [Intoshia linei]|uniref:DNA damage-inducible protein DIN7 n=1 Tax=Intoshia linei TaxID=1819745 RepID=A0A177AU70_9BILA|nr:DNA damage-inducible protein DIN7 [Intoshia linei]